MKRKLVLLILGVMLASTGCIHKAPPIQGSVSQFDSDTYLAISTAKGTIDQAKVELASNAFPTNVAANVKIAINAAVAAYNTADVTYQAYHTAALQGSATPVQQAAVQSAVNNLNTSVSNLTSVKTGN